MKLLNLLFILVLSLFVLGLTRKQLRYEEEFVKLWVRIEIQKMRADKLESALKRICPKCETR